MATLQTIVLGNTAAPQPSVVFEPALPHINNENLRRNKSTVKGLAITEIVLGSVSVLLSVVVFVVRFHYNSGPPYGYGYDEVQIGEGVKCGIWVVIAGGLGIPTAKKNVSWCMINCHMAFSIIGAVFAAVMFSFGVTFALIHSWSVLSIILYSIEALFALATMILCIISASYCCLLLGCCCQTMSPQIYGTQMHYQQQPQIQGQGVPGFQQGFVIQIQLGIQPMPATTSDLTTSYPAQQFSADVQNQQPGLAPKQAEATENPPAYSSFASENITNA